MEVETQKLHAALGTISESFIGKIQSLDDKVQNINKQASQNLAKVETIFHQCLTKLEETVQTLEDFRLVHVPKQP